MCSSTPFEHNLFKAIVCDVVFRCRSANRWGALLKFPRTDINVVAVGLVNRWFLFSKRALVPDGGGEYNNMVVDGHFQIFRRGKNNLEPIFLKCNTHLGVWIGEIHVGAGKVVLLEHGDTLAVGHIQNVLYVFENYVRPAVGGPAGIVLGYKPKAYLEDGLILVDNLACVRESVVKRVAVLENVATNRQPGIMEIDIIRRASEHHCNHIVKLLRRHITGQNYLLEMEYLEGGSLWSYMRRPAQLNSVEIRWFVYQVAAGLEHLHMLGIIHRDIRPKNIMLSTGADPIAKIGNFSSATTELFPSGLAGDVW